MQFQLRLLVMIIVRIDPLRFCNGLLFQYSRWVGLDFLGGKYRRGRRLVAPLGKDGGNFP